MDDKKPQATTASGQPIVVNLIQPDRGAEGAKAMADGRALNMDTTVEGGKYLNAAKQLVNADGEPFNAAKDE